MAIDESVWKLLPPGRDKPECKNSVQAAAKKNLMLYFKHKYNRFHLNLCCDFKETNILNGTRTSEKRNILIPKCKLSIKTCEFVSVTSHLVCLMRWTHKKENQI